MAVFVKFQREEKRREEKRESRCHSRSVYTLFLAASESGSSLSHYAGEYTNRRVYCQVLLQKFNVYLN
jgi:hypothetical protein